MRDVFFVDTTLRDGHSSLWAQSMTTAMFTPVAGAIDEAGFRAAEIVTPSFFKKSVRDLKDDPWNRVRQAARLMPKTPLRTIGSRYLTAFQMSPDSMDALWFDRAAANGISQVRMSDCSNTPFHWARQVKMARAAGLEVTLNLVYSISPRHTDAYYAERARAASKLDVQAICVKDPGGLLTPERVRTLVPAVQREVGDKPLEFHSHCGSGLGPLCALEAMELGIPTINTAIPPLADGASLPSVVNIIKNARTLGFAPQLNEDVLPPVTAHFERVAKAKGLPIGAPAEYDAAHFLYQVPGGMISNLYYHLSQINLSERVPEVLAEIVKVRADLGYPIMVTPYSQFVGTQAAVNVLVGERYKEVIDPVIQYALGLWGEEEASAIEPGVRDKILDRQRARELAKWELPQPTVSEVRQTYGAGLSDDELLLRYLAGERQVEAMRKAPTPSGEATLSDLILDISQRSSLRRVVIQKGALSLHIERAGKAQA